VNNDEAYTVGMSTLTLRKYKHACFVVEKAGQSLVVDPGGWSDDFVMPANVVGIVVTHEHQDHCDPVRLESIIAANPEAVIYAHAAVIQRISHLPTQKVDAGENVHVGEYALSFVGGEHARIDMSIPPIANLGIVIDGSLYYPGDSYALPGFAIATLALPISAPWLKFSEAADFVRAVRPMHVFPTHDAILSSTGKSLLDNMFNEICNEVGAQYQRR